MEVHELAAINHSAHHKEDTWRRRECQHTQSTMTQAHAHGGVVWCGRSVEWSGMVWCGVELVCRNTHNGGEQGLRGTQQAPNSTATGDIQHIET